MSRTDKTRPYKVRVQDPLEDRVRLGDKWWLLHCHHYHYGPPSWFRKNLWWAPERIRERGRLGEFRKEYNATGRLEDPDFPNYQHKHCALWYWF